MSRRSSVLCLTALLIAACSHQGGKPPGLKDAGPVIARFAEAGKALRGLGAAVVSARDGDDVPYEFEDKLTELGRAARSVLSKAEPEGPAGVAAIQKELAATASSVIQALVTAAGGTQKAADSLLSAPPDQIAFTINVPVPPLETDRSDRGKEQAHARLFGDLHLEINHFLYTALLADSAARKSLTPRLSAEDLPKQVDPALNLTVSTTEEWRRLLFDDEGHLVVPSPFVPGRWKAFVRWAQTTNPEIENAMRALTKAPLDELTL